MITCPMSNFIGNHCMPDPVEQLPDAQLIGNFMEEASFFYGLFHKYTVRPVPDPGLMLVLNKSKLKQKKRRVSKKDGVDTLWLSKNPQRAVKPGQDDFDELD